MSQASNPTEISLTNIQEAFKQAKVASETFCKQIGNIDSMWRHENQSAPDFLVGTIFGKISENACVLRNCITEIADELISTNLREFNTKIKNCLDEASKIKTDIDNNSNYNKSIFDMGVAKNVFNKMLERVTSPLNDAFSKSLQKGGSFNSNNNYYSKYLKYKDKYIQLKNSKRF